MNQYNETFVNIWSIPMASSGNVLSASVHSLYFSAIHASCPTGLSDSAMPIVAGLVACMSK
ncbi:hypothetical protein D3C86_2158060 [compost metagenome]